MHAASCESGWPASRTRRCGAYVVVSTRSAKPVFSREPHSVGIFRHRSKSATDANHTYKPDPRAYQLGIDPLHVAKQDIVFAAFGGFDAAGAKSFLYPTVWVNRFDQPIEELEVRPDRTVRDLSGLLDFVLNK